MLLSVALSLVDQAHWVDDLEVALGDSLVHLEDGLLFEVADPEGNRAGWAYVGDASLTFPFHDAGEAMAFGATLGLDRPPAGTWTEPMDVLLVLGEDPELQSVVASLPAVRQDAGALVWTDHGQEHVIVTGHRVGDARRTARSALRVRMDRLATAGLDPEIMIARDRLRQPTGGTPRVIVEGRSERVWLPFLAPAHRTTSDRWLTWIRDTTGRADDEYGEMIAVHGVGPEESPRFRVLTGTPHSAAAERATIQRSTVNLAISPVATGVAVQAEITAQIRVAAPTPTPILDLAIPRRSGASAPGDVQVAPNFELDSATSKNGESLVRLGRVWGPHTVDQDIHTEAWLLPDPVGPEPDPVTLLWRQQWPASNMFMAREWAKDLVDRKVVECPFDVCNIHRIPEMIQLGRAVVAKGVIPSVPGVARSHAVELRAGTAMAQRWATGVGAQPATHKQVGDGTWQVLEVRSDARVSFGDLTVTEASAIGGFPSIRILRHSPFAGGSPQFVRSVINFYQTSLPRYPHGEVVVVQAPDRPVLFYGNQPIRQEPYQPEITGYQGHIVVRGLRGMAPTVGTGSLATFVERNYPHAVERGIAHGLARDWWRLAYSRRDAWLGEALPAMYRNVFMERAYPPSVTDTWQRREERDASSLDGIRFRSLRGDTSPDVGDRGARLLGGALRHRIGERALLEGLDAFQRSGQPTLQRLVTELEATSQMQLDDFFDYWVVTGARPEISGTWTRAKDGIHVVLASDIPYGAMDVPVVLDTRKGARTAWVRLIQGQGGAVLQGKGVRDLRVDPAHWLPLRRRSLTER